jgi:hypothetical protein
MGLEKIRNQLYTYIYILNRQNIAVDLNFKRSIEVTYTRNVCHTALSIPDHVHATETV